MVDSAAQEDEERARSLIYIHQTARMSIGSQTRSTVARCIAVFDGVHCRWSLAPRRGQQAEQAIHGDAALASERGAASR